jgi:predicted enzyme related to lactoylglutathione lyase
MAGELSFLELGVADVDAARAFYGELFGWRFEETPAGGVTIDMGAVTGGIHGGDPEASPICFFRVDEIEAASERVRRLGGSAEPIPGDDEDPEKVARFGRFRLCRDDQGSPFGLHEPPAG